MSLCGPPVARTLRRGADRISDSSIKLVAILPIYGGPPSMVGNNFAQLPSLVRSGSPVPAGVRVPFVVRLPASSLSVCQMTRVPSNTTAEFPGPRAPSSLPRDFLHILISVAALRHAVPDLEFAGAEAIQIRKRRIKPHSWQKKKRISGYSASRLFHCYLSLEVSFRRRLLREALRRKRDFSQRSLPPRPSYRSKFSSIFKSVVDPCPKATQKSTCCPEFVT